MFAKELNHREIENEFYYDADATEIGEMILKGEITATKAVKVYSEYIEKINPTINSVVEKRFQAAFEESKKLDRQLLQGKVTGRLMGVPISMKESFDVSGMQTTGGLLYRKGQIKQKDAEIVRKLKEEGAIILGKSNTPELCFCQETDNKLYGKTNNPRDLAKTVGGSSGGEAATIAVGAAAAGIGSDIGGSIRFPCHFNGVVGFKSGKGQVSAEGSFPAEDDPLQSRMLGIGPITKSVRDAKLIYSIIAQAQPVKKDLSDFTMNILPETVYPLSNETGSLLNEAYENLRNDFLVERVEPPYFHETATLWQEIMSINGGNTAKKEAFKGGPVNIFTQYAKEIARGTAENHRYLLWALIGASLFKPSNHRLTQIQIKITEGDALLARYLENRILVFPVYHTAAPKHGVVYNEIFSVRKTFKKYLPYIAYANVWGLPSLTVPVGKDSEGMPIALQFMSKVGNEDALFQIGAHFEDMFATYERAII